MLNFLRGSRVVVIVYSIDYPSTYKGISELLRIIEERCDENTIKVIVGNKCDRDNDRKV